MNNFMPDREMLRMAFERDDPFTMNEDECFINRKSGDVHWVGPDIDGDPEQFENDPLYICVPGTPHGEWHSVFCEYLDSIGRLSDYTTSIGLTLKLLSEDERSGWFNWKWEYAEKKVQKFIDSLQGG